MHREDLVLLGLKNSDGESFDEGEEKEVSDVRRAAEAA